MKARKSRILCGLNDFTLSGTSTLSPTRLALSVTVSVHRVIWGLLSQQRLSQILIILSTLCVRG